MTRTTLLLASTAIWVSQTLAQVPYTPTQLILSPDGTTVYQFSNPTSPNLLWTLDISKGFDPNARLLSSGSLPYQTDQTKAYIPVADEDGISVVVGDCQSSTTSTSIWRMRYSSGKNLNTWQEYSVTQVDEQLRTNYLAAGFSFSASGAKNSTGVYVFGGMCPTGNGSATSWTSSADYTNVMLRALPSNGSTYDLVGQRSPLVAEAGLTITPLTAIVSNSSQGRVSQAQNFVLLGGHTQSAFINMSQVAVFSLPDGSWAFKGVNQPDSAQGELVRRAATTVEPRSGHSAVLTEDGTQIIVLGGWVGDVKTPASPQMAILELGDQYGTSSAWSWKIPSQENSPFDANSGIYGHGAVMLPGGVMLVTGGALIETTKTKRDAQQYYLYNTTSATWISSYTNPGLNSTNESTSRAHSGTKVGLGVGLGVGLSAAFALAILGFLYARRRKQKRVERERRLRAMALGSGRYQSGSQLSGVGPYSEMRSASWGNAQERHIEHIGEAIPWPLPASQLEKEGCDPAYDADRTGLDLSVPSPTRGLRRNLHSRGPAGFGSHFRHVPVGPGSVFRIDEEDDEVRSIRAVQPEAATSRHSDPFKDPPATDLTASAAQKRKKEVESWVEDWQSAAVSLSRSPSQARTYSNLSQAHSNSQSDSDRGRSSPDKSDRTNSNLSEKSNFSNQSIQRSVVSRTLSQRSVSAGYALFAGAAAAMGRLAGGTKEELHRSASQRSVSMGSAHRYGRSVHHDSRSLLRDESPTKSEHNYYYTPPESPIKDYKNYMRATSAAPRTRARGVLGSMKRVFTGTSQVDVDAKVEHYEEKEKEAVEQVPELTQTTPHGTTVPFWEGKRGARDWEHGNLGEGPSTIRRRSGGRSDEGFNRDDYDGEDWDVETAIQKRVVQVMFTVPKEKLRVVNADALSLLSRSDLGDREEEQTETEFKRMDSVTESDEVESTHKRE